MTRVCVLCSTSNYLKEAKFKLVSVTQQSTASLSPSRRPVTVSHTTRHFADHLGKYAEYIWIDAEGGLRSKTMVSVSHSCLLTCVCRLRCAVCVSAGVTPGSSRVSRHIKIHCSCSLLAPLLLPCPLPSPAPGARHFSRAQPVPRLSDTATATEQFGGLDSLGSAYHGSTWLTLDTDTGYIVFTDS